jgi:hypothetical protein
MMAELEVGVWSWRERGGRIGTARDRAVEDEVVEVGEAGGLAS